MATLIEQQFKEPSLRIHHRFGENKMDNPDMKLDPDMIEVNESNQTTDGTAFIVTDILNEEVLDRPDVPEWFKDQVLSNEMQENRKEEIVEEIIDQTETSKPFMIQIVWRNVIAMILLHILGFYGFYMSIRYAKSKLTFFWAYFILTFGAIGTLAGGHRLWCHRSYKAHWILRTIFMIAQTTTLQGDIYGWTRDHRVHHKYSDTDADPTNSKRGFFFSHIGWLLCREHPQVTIKESKIDMSDVWQDPIIRFQRKFYIPLFLIFCGLIPIYVPVILWGESFWISFLINFWRLLVFVNYASLANSATHMYGYKFYDRTIEPGENTWLVYLSLGEGYHNYHHTFPWDYSASEHGWRHNFNLTTLFIDIAAWLGLATERRVASHKVIEERCLRTGDLSLIPPGYTSDRKPVSAIWDWVLGLNTYLSLLWIGIIAHEIFHE